MTRRREAVHRAARCALVTLAEQFEALRPRLLRIAYGQLGSVAEAEDVLQDAWLRLERVDTDAIRDLEGWLITTVSRLGLDALKSARVRREAYVGPWLPEPIVSADPGPEEVAVRGDEVSLALLVVLESLSASERTAFVLHDVFGYSFDEVAGDARHARSAAARQQAARARKAVEARRPRFPATPEQQREIIVAFGQATAEGDMDGLLALLHPDAVLTSDGGGIVNAARKPVGGRRARGQGDHRARPGRRDGVRRRQRHARPGRPRPRRHPLDRGLHDRRRSHHPDRLPAQPGEAAMRLVLRLSLIFVAVSALLPGLEGTLGPSSFYASFPLGRGWVELLPPYNEHLVRDVGGVLPRVRDPVRVGGGHAGKRTDRALVRDLDGRRRAARVLSRDASGRVSPPATRSRRPPACWP